MRASCKLACYPKDMQSKRAHSVSVKVQSYKFMRRSSSKGGTPPPPVVDDIQEQQRPISPSCELETNYCQMYDISEDGVQLPQRVETVEIMRDSGRATPADPSSIVKKSSKSDLKSRKNGYAYYNDAFAVREEGKKVPAAAGVWVEMKTNVIVGLLPITPHLIPETNLICQFTPQLENEFDFIKSLSEVIAKRFSRTEETVAVSIEHSSCMIMGGTFDGCYFLTINSLSSISPTCNKRNVALISEWLTANLGVPSSRGFIRFVEPDAGNYAMGGITCLDMLEKERSSTRMSMASTDGNVGGRSRKGFLSGRTSRMDKLGENRPPSGTVDSMDSGRETVQSTYTEKARVRRGRSMFNLFGRSQRIPAESPWS